jgi:deoxycytidine triphosphate deaminase
MSVLVDSEIKDLSTQNQLISPFDPFFLQGASYDLRLGEQIARNGEIKTLVQTNPTLKIAPGEFVILSTHEKLNIPLDIIGHNGIMSKWAKRGLVSLFSPQIDPGFRGMLIVPVFNAGDSDVSINLHEAIFTVEFVKTSIPAQNGWSDKNGEQNTIKDLASPSLNQPNLLDILAMKKGIEENSLQIKQLKNNQDLLQNNFDDIYKRKGLNYAAISTVSSVIAAMLSVIAVGYSYYTYNNNNINTQINIQNKNQTK